MPVITQVLYTFSLSKLIIMFSSRFENLHLKEVVVCKGNYCGVCTIVGKWAMWYQSWVQVIGSKN